MSSLRRLGLLDTAPEERFDRITRTAKRMFDVDIALVSLVDLDRQWFKSNVGLDVSSTPRDISFCGHAIAGEDEGVLEVVDAATDPRFADNPLVVGDPSIRFYAGYPISGPDGSKLGTLCLIDHEPRILDADERGALQDLARMVEHEIDVARLAVDDELTGLANRRGFSMMANQALAFCQRQEVDALVVFADVDGLEAVNDRCGRPTGDSLLVEAASSMADAFRASDVVGRIGGDEFAAVLTAFEGDKKWAVERLDRSVQACNQELVDEPFTLSMSVGTARFDHRHPELLETLLYLADEAMYADKQRRRVVTGRRRLD